VVLFLVLIREEGIEHSWGVLLDGSRLTLAILAFLSLAIAIAFSIVFVGFHRIFFEGDTWLFRYSDTLIRLFPERFWRDTFIALVASTTVGACLLYFVSRRMQKRSS
jgi:integral membrane protein (TIGR01906 family)